MAENVVQLNKSSQQDIDRKIAVIFVTDVVGFSKSMEVNEEETLRSFRACQEILNKLFEEHGGRIFNTAGDSVLAEFQSAVSAVVCASEFQKLIKEKATELPITDFRMTRFWITLDQGINFVLSCLKIMQGGEIFIPKIPSMKITDLAHSMAPDLLHREIGIRAGEKLHELMISEDDARNSFEFTDRYAILTPFLNPEKSIYERRGGELVGSGFSYASETNAEWLTPEDFKKLI